MFARSQDTWIKRSQSFYETDWKSSRVRGSKDSEDDKELAAGTLGIDLRGNGIYEIRQGGRGKAQTQEERSSKVRLGM